MSRAVEVVINTPSLKISVAFVGLCYSSLKDMLDRKEALPGGWPVDTQDQEELRLLCNGDAMLQ